MLKMSKLHYDKWTGFLNNDKNTLTKAEQELLARLHSIYFKHTYFLPCTCSPKTYNNWIEQLNVIYKNGKV
tara:strand:+ start:217 stop:429 length:213 start_codon:yes stop_codon:yes gene_type:complete